jgi:hypothetical protein
MNVNITWQTVADARNMAQGPHDTFTHGRTYWNAVSIGALIGIGMIGCLGEDGAAEELPKLINAHLALANAFRDNGNAELDALNRGTAAGYDAALTDGDTVDDVLRRCGVDDEDLMGSCGICEAPGVLVATDAVRCPRHRDD